MYHSGHDWLEQKLSAKGIRFTKIEKGWILKGDTIKDLGSNMGIDPGGLQESVAKHNQYYRNKKDAKFGKQEGALLLRYRGRNSLNWLSTQMYSHMLQIKLGGKAQAGIDET